MTKLGEAWLPGPRTGLPPQLLGLLLGHLLIHPPRPQGAVTAHLESRASSMCGLMASPASPEDYVPTSTHSCPSPLNSVISVESIQRCPGSCELNFRAEPGFCPHNCPLSCLHGPYTFTQKSWQLLVSRTGSVLPIGQSHRYSSIIFQSPPSSPLWNDLSPDWLPSLHFYMFWMSTITI